MIPGLRNIIAGIFLTLAFVSQGNAQGYFWETAKKKKHYKYVTVDAGIGLRMYSGDIQQRGSLLNPASFAYGLGVRYQMRPRFGLALHAAGRGYRGKAEHGGFPDAIDEMSGKLWEGAVMMQYSWLKWEDFTKRMFTDRDPVTKVNGFLGVGVGAAMFSASYVSRKYKTQIFKDTLGRDSAEYVPVNTAGAGSGIGIHVPMVVGFRYRFDPSWSLALEMHYHLYFNDNLDGLVRKNNDGMNLWMLKVGYSFGQNKKRANIGKTPRKLLKGK